MPRPSPVRALAASCLLLLTACGSTALNPATTVGTSPGSAAPVAPNTLTLSGASLPVQLTAGQTLQLNVNVNGHAAQSGELVWTSSDAGVAQVNASGLLTASAAGSTTIHVVLAAAPTSSMDIPTSVSGAAAPPATGTTPAGSFAQQVLTLANAVRAQARTCGNKSYAAAPALSPSAALMGSAQGHASDMAARNYFGHDTPEGVTPEQRMTAAGYVWKAAGENIAAGQTSPEAVVNSWLGSAGHCANLMSPTFADVGVGYAAGGSYGSYWVMDFGAR